MIQVAARVAVMVLTVLAVGVMGFGAPTAQGSQATAPVVSLASEDQTGLSLTIYNVNLGLVKDRR